MKNGSSDAACAISPSDSPERRLEKHRSQRRLHAAAMSAIVLAATALLIAGGLFATLSSIGADSSVQESRADDVLASATCALLAFQDSDPPVADAGANMTVVLGAIVTLNGSSSSDDVEVTAYTWTFEDNGTTQVLEGEAVDYVFWTPGNFTITLNVSDAEGHWDTDSVLYTVNEDLTPPTIVTALNRTSVVGDQLVLNASRSSDNARIVNFTWAFEYDGEEVTLYGNVMRFYFNKTGTYEVNLTVTDASNLTSSVSIIVEVRGEASWFSKHLFKIAVTALIGSTILWFVARKLRKDRTLFTDTDKEKLGLQWKSFLKTWRIFKANRIGMTGFTVLLAFVIIAIFAPLLSTVQDPNNTDHAEPVIISDDGDPTNDWVNPLPPSLTPSPYTGYLHLLGTDHKGQDIYSLTLVGARASLYVGLVATAISALLGAVIGLGAGYFGKAMDEVLMRATDFFLVLPWFPLMIVMMAILGRDFVWVIVVIGITSWPSTARIVRSQVLTVKERQFIERARAIGAGDGHIISKHIMPNVMPLIFANTVLLISLAIFSESFLSFFGLGDPTVVSWGGMLEGAYNFGAFYKGAWWYILPPGLCILGMVLSFSLVGYALDDVLNPKLRKR